jgi:predicted DNA-binding protein (MmcQ/YjbR family)
MDLDWIRKFCLALPGASERIQWEDDLLFKVGGKMFAVVRLEPGPVWMSLKSTDEDFAALTEMPGVIPAPYLARAKWVALETESALPRSEVHRLLRQSYDLVFAKLTKKIQTQITASAAKKKRR